MGSEMCIRDSVYTVFEHLDMQWVVEGHMGHPYTVIPVKVGAKFGTLGYGSTLPAL